MHIPSEITNHATADVLEGARSKARLTQAQYAERAGMSLVTVQKLLTGNQSMKMSQFLALANATGLDVGDLTREVQELARTRMSEASAHNVTSLHPRDMSITQLENYERKAADGFTAGATEPEEN